MSHRCTCLGCDPGERLEWDELRFFTTRFEHELDSYLCREKHPRCARCGEPIEEKPYCECTADELREWIARAEITSIPPTPWRVPRLVGVLPL